MDADDWRTRSLHLRRNVRKHGIDKVMIRRGDQRQRVLACERRVALRRLVRGLVACQRIQPRLGHALRNKLKLAGWSREAVRERNEWVGVIQAHPTTFLKRLKADPLQRWMAGVEDLAGDFLIAVIETWNVQSHGPRQPAEDFGRRQAFSRRSDSGLVPQDIKVSIRDEEIGVLKLHRGRQNNVGELSSVGQKMFDHDREEIGASQSVSHFYLLRNAGERIAPINEEGFDRRVGLFE